MRYVLIALLFLSCSKNEIEQVSDVLEIPDIDKSKPGLNVREVFGAVGNGVADDWEPLQRAIDSAIKTNGKVYIPAGRYRISKPLVAARRNAAGYGFITVEIYGESKMWDVGSTVGSSIIVADFKDKFALGLHLNKGSIVRNLHFEGKYKMGYTVKKHYLTELADYNADSTCRDTRFSPYAGIVIDPFRPEVPPDGGYPGMSEYYYGNNGRSGSTGIRIEDVTSANFTIAFLISPNGKTLNAELLTFQNIRVGQCKIGFQGCQAQEKMNRIINVGAWDYIHTLFSWNYYGLIQPGDYYIDGVNIAGYVRQILYRATSDWFALHMTNVFAERVFTVGTWQGAAGDSWSNSTVDFMWFNEVPSFPDWHLGSTGATPSVSLSNVKMMYYGQYHIPMFLRGSFPIFNSVNRGIYKPAVHAYRYDISKPDTLLTKVASAFINFYDSLSNKKGRVNTTGLSTGDIVFFVQNTNNDYAGMGMVESTDATSALIRYCSPKLVSNIPYSVFKYK